MMSDKKFACRTNFKLYQTFCLVKIFLSVIACKCTIRITDEMDMTPLQASCWRGKFLRRTQSGTPSIIIYTWWSRRRYGLGCHAPMVPRAQLEGRSRRTTNHEGVVAVTPDRPWCIPIITWLNNFVWNVFTTKYVQNLHQIERCRLLASIMSIVTSRFSP